MQKTRHPVLTLATATVAFSLLAVAIGATTLSGLAVAGGRALFALPACWAWAIVVRRKRSDALLVPQRADVLRILLSGLFLTGNWFFYALAIKASSVSIAVVSLFTYPLVTALLEPLFTRERLDGRAAIGGVAIVAGVALLSPGADWSHPDWAGIGLGFAAGLSFALRTLLSKPLASTYHPASLMAWQFALPTIILAPWFLGSVGSVLPIDWALLPVIGTILTAGALILFTASLRKLSSAHASIGMSMQPVLSIVLAIVLLGEAPGLRTWLGAALITAAVLFVSLRRRAR